MPDTKKQHMSVYLDEFEKDKLKKIAEGWGVSLSAAIRRLVREHQG